MFGGADGAVAGGPPAGWDRLEQAARAATDAVAEWRRRAREAEAEVARLREVLEEVSVSAYAAAETGGNGGLDEEARRLRAENALLRSRTEEARRRVADLLARLALLEGSR